MKSYHSSVYSNVGEGGCHRDSISSLVKARGTARQYVTTAVRSAPSVTCAAYARQHGSFRPQDVTAKIIEEFGIGKEVARKVPAGAAAAGFLKKLKMGLYESLHG